MKKVMVLILGIACVFCSGCAETKVNDNVVIEKENTNNDNGQFVSDEYLEEFYYNSQTNDF